MGIMNLLLAVGLLTGAPEQAVPQLFDLTLYTEMRYGSGPGGRNTWSARPLTRGRSLTMLTHSISNSCGFAAGSLAGFEPGSAIGWQLDATPVEITGDHAVLRLSWSRKIELGVRTGNDIKEAVVLLRPGDSLPLDTFLLPEVVRSCSSPVATLFVGLREREPERTRVTTTDLWLVHKHPGGKETTQHLNVRGEFHASIPFYFDEERVGTAVLDVFGRFTLRPKAGDSVALEFSAQRLLAGEQNAVNYSHFGGGGRMVTEIGPDSVTEFAIPQGSGPAWAAFAGHSLSVRVRSRKMR